MKILLAVDESGWPEVEACALAAYPPDAEVRVLHVVDWPAKLPACYRFAEGASADGDVFDARDRMIADADLLVGRVAASLRRRYRSTSTFVAVGDPAAEILQTARSWGADLIIVGTHGRRGLDRVAFGSISDIVLRRARCAVETVPKGRANAAAAG